MHITTSSLNYNPKKYEAHFISSSTVLTRNFLVDAWIYFRMIFGGEIKSYTKLTTQGRDKVFAQIEQQAKNLEADMVVSLRIETNSIHPGTLEVFAYATALVAK